MRSERSARIARFHHNGELTENTELALSRQASHHLINVLRTRAGDVIELFNGDGRNYRATVIDTGQRGAGKNTRLQLHEATSALSESPVVITLIQAISRGDKMDTTLRQSVELGVSRIQPVYSRHSIKPLSDQRLAKKQEHWQSIVISACEQSGRAVIPELCAPMALTQWTDQFSGVCAAYVLSPVAEQSLTRHLLQVEPHPSSIGLLVGPESGLDQNEISQAVSAGMHAVNAGPRILRTETAGPACLAVVQSIVGDFS